MTHPELIDAFKQHGIIKQGNFTLKSGLKTKIYVDVRSIISYPDILSYIVQQIAQRTNDVCFDAICGVPYGAVPLASCTAMLVKKPLLLCRKERKDHGSCNMIEGVIAKGSKVLLIEDVLTTGQSIEQTIALLEAEDLLVTDIVVVVDRNQGGRQLLENKGYKVHALFKLDEFE
jgi:uridine monophosphate synthetase